MRPRTIFFQILLFVMCSLSLRAETWKGQWIGLDEESSANTWLCFRKQISVDTIPNKLPVKIACDSKYWLWVNDRLVIFEGQLKRGPNPTGTYFDMVDIGPCLSKGQNQIAVLVWYFGKNGFSHNSSGKAGFVLDGPIAGLISDASWKVIRHPAFGGTKDPRPNFRLPESNIRFNAQKDIPGWTKIDFDDSTWPSAKEFGVPPAAPWGMLVSRPILQWKDYGLTDYVSVEVQKNQDDSQTVIGKLPYNAQVTPYLKVESPAGRLIDIRTDNYMGGSVPSVRTEYLTTEGPQEFETYGWMNGHDVRYTLPADVKILAVKYRQTGYNAEFRGVFRCEDEKLNVLWEKAKRTLYVTMRDNYMDCPDRERAQWWGDAVNELGEAFYVFDAQNGPLLTRKAIYELAGWQRQDKVLYSPVPAGVPGKTKENPQGTWDKELAPQMLASVGWYGFWTYYVYSGDKQTLVDVYPSVRDYLSLWKLGENGLVIHRPGDWDWTDWGEEIDAAVTDSAWVYLALKAAVKMAELSGHTADVTGYQKTMDSIEANFNKVFWQAGQYRSPGYKGKTDDRANAMAVIAGLAKPEYYEAIREVFRKEYHASPYMEKYVLESLYIMDAPDQAVERMKRRFAAQIDSPLTTLWEGWGIGSEGYGGGTYNHAWSGGALTVLSQYAAGVAPIQPGFREFAVMPQMGSLKQIDSLVPTLYGDIQLELLNDDIFKMELKVPEKTTAKVGIPVNENPSMIRMNGKIVYQDGKGLSSEYFEKNNRWIVFCVASGQWIIEAE